jgi:hypothetical protein
VKRLRQQCFDLSIKGLRSGTFLCHAGHDQCPHALLREYAAHRFLSLRPTAPCCPRLASRKHHRPVDIGDTRFSARGLRIQPVSEGAGPD